MPVRRISGQTGPVHTGADYRGYVATTLTRIAPSQGMAVPLPDPGDPAEIGDSPPLRTVFLHEDRWIVQCPDCGRDLSFMFPEERLYMCAACWNTTVGGLYRRIALPPDWERINREAGHAPNPKLRNWIPQGANLKGAFATESEQTAAAIIREFEGYG